MAKNDDFSTIYSPAKVDEILNKNPKPYYHKTAFRLIKHSHQKQITDADFYPSIMEYTGSGEMPSYEAQNRKTNLGLFGVSCFDTKEHLNSYLESVTSLREQFETENWFIVKGFVNRHLGFADQILQSGPKIGHFNYFLFDPINKNPKDDFNDVELQNDD